MFRLSRNNACICALGFIVSTDYLPLVTALSELHPKPSGLIRGLAITGSCERKRKIGKSS